MPYCTQADLEARYGEEEIFQLADRDGSGVADPGVVETAIAAAGVEIDGYLAVKYALPLAAVPELVRQLACEIARYRLWKDMASERVRQDYEDAVRRLGRLASGGMSLTDLAGQAPVAGTSASVAVAAPVAVFDDVGMAGYCA